MATASSGDAVDPLDSREHQLLAIARRLFAQHGYDRTSLRDIAQAACITKSALYYYFPNKDALYERIVLESVQLLHDRVARAVAQEVGGVARVRAFMAASAQVQDQGRDGWIAGSNAFWQAATGGRRMAALELRDSYENLLRQCINDAMAAGELRAADPAMVGRLLLSALNHMPRWHKPGGTLSGVEVMQQFVDMLLYGLLRESKSAVLAEPAEPAVAEPAAIFLARSFTGRPVNP
ncbi:TetR/AcrR family transcriptional regulator [Variovorax sp. H27-G14]|uniref:TetR/AcrR family transcriptional regulator n=1 Tax=Variovorax sp. H27-G14 TaxID=3111914 RepID=UPI0038FCD46F